ncbi:MAG: hypothetical protein WCT19_03945 [Candidatus Paceibacterota bacterium]|jgi:hypothetical protein
MKKDKITEARFKKLNLRRFNLLKKLAVFGLTDAEEKELDKLQSVVEKNLNSLPNIVKPLPAKVREIGRKFRSKK